VPVFSTGAQILAQMRAVDPVTRGWPAIRENAPIVYQGSPYPAIPAERGCQPPRRPFC
jgi:hypothetical protein